MRVLVLHSDVPPGAPPDEQDTLLAACAVVTALRERGHDVLQRAFVPDPATLAAELEQARADVVFNLVESVFGQGDLAGLAPAMLEARRIPFTGASAAAIALSANKPLTKRILRGSGLPTPAWSAPPRWEGLADGRHYVVKSANEDASAGLDDGAVVAGHEAVLARASLCAARHGGSWFAEEYLSGREFNVSLLEVNGEPHALPVAEIQFQDWERDRPRLVGYAAKWEADSPDCNNTPRVFGLEDESPPLNEAFKELSRSTWQLLGVRGYARVDFRLDATGAPMILEINPNPCIEPEAGFAAAAAKAGISYAELVDRILQSAFCH